MVKFNVIHYDSTHRKVIHYDVLPYFREEWNDKYHKEEKNKIKETKSKELLRQWIVSRSSYRFWGRCEYEHLIAPWPFGSYRIKEDLKKFLGPAQFIIENIKDYIYKYNIAVCNELPNQVGVLTSCRENFDNAFERVCRENNYEL